MRPETALLVLFEDVCGAFSFEASMLPVGWHVLTNETDRRLYGQLLIGLSDERYI